MTALPEQKEYERLGSLDGLRSIAIILVVFSHYVIGGDPNRGIRSLVYKVSMSGWVGVDLFFVLSGFLITGILVRARDQPHRFRNFYARRTLRIFPLYYAALAIAFIIIPLASSDGVPWRDQWPYWFYVSNFRIRDVVAKNIYVGHFWSLAIEEQFYAVWPAVVLLASTRVARRACVAIIVGSVAVRFGLVAMHSGWRPYYWTFSRGDALACGSYIALCFQSDDYRRRAAKWAMPVAAVVGLVLGILMWWNRLETIYRNDSSPATMAGRILVPLLLAFFFSALLILALQRPRIARALDIGPFRFIARYSYGWYVWHGMLIPAVIAYAGTWPLWPRAFAGIGASFVVAIASYHLFESPFLALKRYFPQRHL
jgi:peptidoglycan/LPS O-acetylase OafA/YrhL